MGSFVNTKTQAREREEARQEEEDRSGFLYEHKTVEKI